MKRQQGMPRRAGQPDRSRLRDARRPARAVQCEASRLAGAKVPLQLNQRPDAAA